ncbi:hypothetical protein HU200_006460 [Digitaria exilis]|uniref:Uncharacterized protein n=1 Tax=Digitaria exilis TaxID=1010633 RepID=A0A835KRR1_9POAL|nr:hypothetical protein HU200_006460 [Digitaria exilis]
MGMLILFLLSVSYNAIFSFGDSISDTGNLCTGSGGCPPYGNTHFGHPTGRCTDGRVVVDFLAEHFGLPLLPPSKASGGDFKKGANMVIIGATTMDFEFFNIWNNGALGTQIQWFQQLMPSICGSDCKTYLNSSLFVVGEFGGNDYNAPLFGGKNVHGRGQNLRAPDHRQDHEQQGQIIDLIVTVNYYLQALIELGATELVVPGVLPIGCFPLYLTLYPSSNKDDYDEIGCLKSFNNLSGYHNNLLKRAVSGLQSKHAGVRLMYADFYAQVVDMVRSPETFASFSDMLDPSQWGFHGHTQQNGLHLAGMPMPSLFDGARQQPDAMNPWLKYGLRERQGSYNYNNRAWCGMSGSSACGDPEKHLDWDGIHLTDAAYHAVADGWLNGTYCSPGILH